MATCIPPTDNYPPRKNKLFGECVGTINGIFNPVKRLILKLPLHAIGRSTSKILHKTFKQKV